MNDKRFAPLVLNSKIASSKYVINTINISPGSEAILLQSKVNEKATTGLKDTVKTNV
jgi:hypothetical protein